MILEVGDKILVSNRRIFEGDEARFFLGETIGCEGTILKIEGFTFVRDLASGNIVKKAEKRIRVLTIDSPGYIIYQLPGDIDVETVDIACTDGEAILMDGSRELMNLSERTHCGHF